MKVFLLILSIVLHLGYAREPFTDLENVVGYIVVERKGRVENHMVVEGKDGSVRTVKVERNPREFLKKSDDGTQKR
ncbi:hypothetical protein [Thermocrinis sp.]